MSLLRPRRRRVPLAVGQYAARVALMPMMGPVVKQPSG